MSLHITSQRMTSSETSHHAERSPDRAANGHGAWIVSWLPLRALTRDQAITAMTLAETVNSDHDQLHRMWPHVDGWAAELQLKPEDAQRLARDPS